MNLHEYQAREIFARYGVPLPRGELAYTSQEAYEIASRLGVPVMVKAQVLVGGRGKAGGIKSASNPQAARETASHILEMSIKGLAVEKVLVVEAVEIEKELYLGVVVDRALCAPVMIASSEGGVEIEEVARTMPERLAKITVDPFLGLRDCQARQLALEIGLGKEKVAEWIAIAQGLYKAFVECDASLAEINPLALTREGRLLAIDTKMVLDDNALFRHRDLEALRDLTEEEPREREARGRGLSYVKLEGEIGCLVNGAGLAMATMDVIKLYGGEPANFLDVGGGARAEQVAVALCILLSDENVKAVLINIFGGITRCDEVARGILEALRQVRVEVPMVVRLGGTNEREGRRLLADADIETASTLVEAAQRAVEAAKGG
ncbi:MAG: ADP-forming succinate--CoA ligase subunit beta [Anaerolineae bacterium]